MILALSFLVPDAVMTTAIEVPYIETVERITNVGYIIVEHLAKVNEPQDFGFWLRFKTSVSWLKGDVCTVWKRPIDWCKQNQPPYYLSRHLRSALHKL